MSQDYGMRARVAGRLDIAARTVWQLSYRNIGFRCLRTEWDGGPKAYLLQIKAKGGWQDTNNLSDAPHKLFAWASDAVSALELQR